jgi:hypothetical protein
MIFGLLVAEKVEHIFQRAGFGFVHLRVSALRAGDGCKFLILDVKEFREKSAGASNFSGIEASVTALGTLPVSMLHKLLD